MHLAFIFGSLLGVMEIGHEVSTNDGVVYDALTTNVQSNLGSNHTVIWADDGVQFGGCNTL